MKSETYGTFNQCYGFAFKNYQHCLHREREEEGVGVILIV